MNLRAVLWSRLVVGVLLVIFLLLYTAQYKNYQSNYAYLADRYSKLVVHSGGLSAQLQLLMERNHRAEKLLADLHTKYNQIMEENSEKRQNDDVERLVCKETLRKCLAGATTDGKQFIDEKDGSARV
ncbi:unnamed protein product [Onchocerca ochengi]|uniref:Rod shape-determining protein MreC n=1 Tax=Onchocerca ochengi TaxID=42157 RepID=A0A182DXC6_ONCOC|nr:unnamed protein product [Onchocerca ochengi]